MPTPVVHLERTVTFRWRCPTCLRDNADDPVIPELDPDDRRAIAAEGGDPDPAAWRTCPSVVACGGCGREFEAVDPRATEGRAPAGGD